MVNMSKCSNCYKNNLKVEQVPADMLEEEDMSDSDTEEETETVTYNHVCAECDHVVSMHKVGLYQYKGLQLCKVFDDGINQDKENDKILEL